MRVTLRLSNPDRPELSEHVSDALVDTGATFTTIPRPVSERLALRKIRQRQIRTAMGPQTRDESYALFEYDGNRTVTPVLGTDTLDLVLVGVNTLEALSFVVDPTSGELRESEAYLL